jgi:Fe-S-cluster-containing dehydrogenase component/DMSO reductase anchor subunit
MSLPLLTRAAEDDGTFVHVSVNGSLALAGVPDVYERDRPEAARCGLGAEGRFPDRPPAAGEQYRFHIDMDSCIGCKCCVVACNEQNGNPAEINWRRVAEVEGGTFPLSRRAYFSMGCNHCTEPTCLAGCPVDAYSKDEATGIVRHSAETCIGCQYCTWTCSYGVPQFNPERGVVGKCDMCHGRLALGQAPACVSACPEGAIGIEIVNVADWRAAIARAADRSGMPSGDGSVSATRVSIPASLPPDTRAVNLDVVVPAESHWPLVVMTVLTQMAVGAYAAILVAVLLGVSGLGPAAAAAFGVTGAGLACSTLHLGRPIHAYRAMKMWRRSWLSREAVLFTVFAKAASGFAAVLWFGWPGAVASGLATVLLGLAGVTATAFIYQVPSRPLWHSSRTFVQFFATTVLLGSLSAAAAGAGPVGIWRLVAAITAAGLAGFAIVTYRRLATSPSVELRGAATLLSSVLAKIAVARLVLLAVGGILLPALTSHPIGLAAGLLLATLGELTGRYLFFVAAVPRHMTAAYFARREAA